MSSATRLLGYGDTNNKILNFRMCSTYIYSFMTYTRFRLHNIPNSVGIWAISAFLVDLHRLWYGGRAEAEWRQSLPETYLKPAKSLFDAFKMVFGNVYLFKICMRSTLGVNRSYRSLWSLRKLKAKVKARLNHTSFISFYFLLSLFYYLLKLSKIKFFAI